MRCSQFSNVIVRGYGRRSSERGRLRDAPREAGVADRRLGRLRSRPDSDGVEDSCLVCVRWILSDL